MEQHKTLRILVAAIMILFISQAYSTNAIAQSPASMNVTMKYQIDTTWVTGKTKYNPVYHTAEDATLKRLSDYVLATHVWDSTNFGGLAQNLSNTALTWNGNYTQHVGKYGIAFDKANYFTVLDTGSTTYLLNLNNTSVSSSSMLYANSNSNLVKVSVLGGFAYAQGSTAQLKIVAGGNSIQVNSTTGISKASLGVTNTPYLEADSATKSVNITHLSGLTPAPTIAAGAGAGALPTVTVGTGSTDLSGYVVVVTGVGCTSSSNVATITFNSTYASVPKFVQIFPANAATSALAVTKQCFIDQASGANNTTFTISSNTTALSDATSYQWRYLVIQ